LAQWRKRLAAGAGNNGVAGVAQPAGVYGAQRPAAWLKSEKLAISIHGVIYGVNQLSK